MFSIRDGVQNNAWLPEELDIAKKTGTAMHFGNHPEYSANIKGMLADIEIKHLNGLASDAPEYKAKLKLAAADVHALQNIVHEKLMVEKPSDFDSHGRSKVQHSQMHLASGDTRNFTENPLRGSFDDLVSRNGDIYNKGISKFNQAFVHGWLAKFDAICRPQFFLYGTHHASTKKKI